MTTTTPEQARTLWCPMVRIARREVAVEAASAGFRENKLTTDFRDLVAARGGSIEALPAGSFKASGTMVNTVIVTIPN